MKTYIVDASVAARFLLVEELSEQAKLVLKDYLGEKLGLEAPELIIYEVGNTLWKAAQQGYLASEEAKQKFHHFLQLKIGFVNFGKENYERILMRSMEADLTYYDAAYIEAARKTGATLLTADNTLYEKASKEVSTLHLKNYGSQLSPHRDAQA